MVLNEGRPVECIIYNEELGILAISGVFNSIFIMDVNTFEIQRELKGHTDSVSQIIFDKNVLISASDDSSFIIWVIIF